MKTLLRHLSFPFQGIKQAPRVLFLSLLTGSFHLALFLLRGLARAVRLGWTAAMHLDTPRGRGLGPAPADGGSAPSAAKSGRKPAAGPAADDVIERVGLGCLIILGVVVATGAMAWLFMWLAWPRIAPFAPRIAAVLAGAWIVAAWMAAPPAQNRTTLNDHKKWAGEHDQESDQDHFNRELVRFIVAAVRDAAANGHKGVHIAELLERLWAEARGFDSWGQARLREWCKAAGVPVARNVRAKGKGPTWGVRDDELRMALGTSLNEALEALAQPAPAGPAAGPARAEVNSPVPPPVKAHVPAGHGTPAHSHAEAAPGPSPDASVEQGPVGGRCRLHLRPPGHLPSVAPPSTGRRQPRRLPPSPIHGQPGAEDGGGSGPIAE
ncbi:hypothetical protein ACFWGI_06435 [Streptomyces niveus]|uniref:hypothetical protein n=1 Tax=Streptomyces niveus TaxID=193462 RepID=UPI0036684327